MKLCSAIGGAALATVFVIPSGPAYAGALFSSTGNPEGKDLQFAMSFATPLGLPPHHYSFVPPVQLTSGYPFWVSGVNPIVGGTDPLTPDFQEWISNAALDADWLRVVTDDVAVASPVFDATYSPMGSFPELTH
jgi:hypothetical protein